MFTKIVVLAAALAAATVNADKCSGSELLKYSTLLKSADATSCLAATGFAFYVVPSGPTGEPDDAQLTKMCNTPACGSLVTALASKNPTDCDLVNTGASLNVFKLTQNFAGNCARLVGGSAPVPTTAAPVPTTAAPVPTTAAPVPTTAAPVPTTAAPVPTTASPVPTTQRPQC